MTILGKNRRPVLGLLMIDSYALALPGSMGSDETFPYQMERRWVAGSGAREVLRGDSSVGDSFIASARELENHPVDLITTNCGFLVKFQTRIAQSVSVPVVTSPLLLVPLLRQMLPGNRHLGILTFDSRDLSNDVSTAAGFERDSPDVVIRGVENCASWQVMWEREATPDVSLMERELVELTRDMVKTHPEVGMLVLECAAMPPFAETLQEEFGLPVFDIRSAVNFLVSGMETKVAVST